MPTLMLWCKNCLQRPDPLSLLRSSVGGQMRVCPNALNRGLLPYGCHTQNLHYSAWRPATSRDGNVALEPNAIVSVVRALPRDFDVQTVIVIIHTSDLGSKEGALLDFWNEMVAPGWYMWWTLCAYWF